jgi:hypothetical protein
VLADAEETWQHTDMALNSTGDWARVAPWSRSTPTAGVVPNLLDLCKRRRDRLEKLIISGVAHYDILNIGKWQLGDVVTKIAGRELTLASNGGTGARYPSIVAITENLAAGENGNQQWIQIELDDQRHTMGAAAFQRGGAA